MADTLTADERAAIEEALNAGKVQRVPQGESGLPHLVWCPKDNSLKHPDPEKRRMRPVNFAGSANLAKRRRDQSIAAAKRRERVARLRAQGLKVREIAAKLGANFWTIRNDFQTLNKGSKA